MKIELLRNFVVIMKHKSVSRAAEELGITQPSSSKLLSQLEKEINFRLFERIKGRLHPTSDGSLFYKLSLKTLSGFDSLMNSAEQISNKELGVVNLRIMPALANGMLTRVIKSFSLLHPSIRINLVISSSEEVVESIEGGSGDIGIAMRVPQSEGYTHHMVKMHSVCICPNDHALASKSVVSLKEVTKYNIIGISSDITKPLNDNIANMLLSSPTIMHSTNHNTTCCHLVAADLGIGIIDPMTALSYKKLGIKLIKLKEKIPFNFFLLTSNHYPLSLSAAKFMSYLENEITKVISELQHH
ncbi:LysR family transcriptional regulator [Psychromonas ossibalaenae]|uniref:LysR family transcriptional regulator n=1 Tax=Psychromonas ossibalaenae TaxID=444922 RepID=UPI000366ADE1|nr:LysR family transcriptional regulator [Psychromonas ossibalaenae]